MLWELSEIRAHDCVVHASIRFAQIYKELVVVAHGEAGPRPAGARRRIWKPIPVEVGPVRIFYTFVIYQGYDMDILSGKGYDVVYHRYDMDIPNANNLEQHILVIYLLTFGQIF